MSIRNLGLLVVLLALLAGVAVACGNDSDSAGATPTIGDEDATPTEVDPTQEALDERTSDAERDIERSIRRLESRLRSLRNNIARSGGFIGTPEEQPFDWFDECCDDEQRDIEEELLEAENALADLVAAYEDVGADTKLEMVRQLGTHSANMNTLLAVLAALPTSDGSAAILDDLGLELTAMSEVLAALIG